MKVTRLPVTPDDAQSRARMEKLMAAPPGERDALYHRLLNEDHGPTLVEAHKVLQAFIAQQSQLT